MKKNIFLFLFVLLSIGNLSAEQITKVAVVDLDRIMQVYHSDSRSVREIERRRQEFQEEILRLNDEIKNLEEQYEAAVEEGDDKTALDLENQIFHKKAYLREYINTKEEQLETMSHSSTQRLNMAEDILHAIEYIAESNGYSIIIKKSDPNLLWWSHEVDITDEVLKVLLD